MLRRKQKREEASHATETQSPLPASSPTGAANSSSVASPIMAPPPPPPPSSSQNAAMPGAPPMAKSSSSSSQHLPRSSSPAHMASRKAMDADSAATIYESHSGRPFASRHFPASNSVDAMSHSTSPHGTAGLGFYQQGSTSNNSTSQTAIPSSRSQSTFNFILSKAKNSFSSSSTSHQQNTQGHAVMQHPTMNASSSLPSVHAAGSGSLEDSGSAARDIYPAGGGSIMARSSQSDFANPRHPTGMSSRPSFGEDAKSASSPTKRSLFGSRERKASIQSIGKGPASLLGTSAGSVEKNSGWGVGGGGLRSPFPQSPLGRGHRTEGPGMHYGQFSKSQSDLHMRGAHDFPSPVKRAAELPPVPVAPASLLNKMKSAGGDSSMLQSPGQLGSFSRSVDDLSRGPSPELRTSASHDTGAVWGELGVAASERGRASDTGTMANIRGTDRIPHSPSLPQGAGQIPFSTAPSYQANPTLRNTAWPNDSTSQAPMNQFLSAQLYTPNTARVSSPSRESSRSRNATSPPMATIPLSPSARPLPNGVDFEGFLNRNANVTLSISQLSDAKGKEKDVSKGWKPYKVLLREGKLFFYKPSGNVADEVKALFPASVVSGYAQGDLAYSRDKGLQIEDIQRNRIGTQDLLNATSRGTMDHAPPVRSPGGRRVNGGHDRLSAIADDVEDEGSEKTHTKPAWEQKGKHVDLVLVGAAERPKAWWQRVETGSLEALAHEYVFATQLEPAVESDASRQSEAEGFLYSMILPLIPSARLLQRAVEEISKWTAVASNLTRENERFANNETAWVAFADGLRARISVLIDADVVNSVESARRSDVRKVLEDLIALAWANNREQAEIQSTKLGEVIPSSPPQDWIGLEHQHERSRFTSALRPSALLELDPSTVAQQIHIFTAGHFESLHLPPKSLLRLLCRENADSLQMSSFDWTRPHFLTHLVLDHVLQNASSSSSEHMSHASKAKMRASVLRHWIAVASFLLTLDNVSAWMAICVALCSRAVARLASSWRFVATNDRHLVSNVWAPILARLGWNEANTAEKEPVAPFLLAASSIKASLSSKLPVRSEEESGPNTIPYIGGAVIHASKLAIKSADDQNGINIRSVGPIAQDLLLQTQQWRMRSTATKLAPTSGEKVDLQRAMQSLCVMLNESTNTFDLPRLLSLSLQLEPSSLGRADRRPKVVLTETAAACSASPLILPEALPNLSILQKEKAERLIASSKFWSEQYHPAEIKSSSSKHFKDLQGESDVTITRRNADKRVSLNVSPMARQKAFAARPVREVPYSSITEWSITTGTTEERIIRIGSDLVLSSVSEQSASVPPSPRFSKRFSQEFERASRPVSQISKRSSLPASNRSSMIDIATTPLPVMIKAGTLERLIDVLVMGVSHISIDPEEDSAERNGGTAKRSRLSMDLTAYRKTFLATYRSFCSSDALFDSVRRRFSAAISASREENHPLQSKPAFPSWTRSDLIPGPSDAHIDWELVITIRSGVTSFLQLWAAQFPQDFAEENQLYQNIFDWIEETKSTTIPLGDEVEWSRTIDSLSELKKQVQMGVMTCCIRQVERRAMKRSSKRTSTRRTPPSSQPTTLNFDNAGPQELVDYLESVARVFFEKIEEKDLLMASELFQSRTNDSMAWFIAKNSTSTLASQHPDEMPQVNNMYKLLELVRWPRDGITLSHRLAASIRDACAAQNLLRGWIAIHIIESKIGVVRRQARIEKLLDAVWICRARMYNSRTDELQSSSSASVFREPTVASFIECLIVGSLTSSESRLFTRAWQGVASKRRGNCDSLRTLFPPPALAETYLESTMMPSTPDIGWVLKTIAEVMARSLDVGRGEDETLVDFGKYRTIWNIIESSVTFRGKGKSSSALDPEAVELAGARLTSMQNALRNVTWERRNFKDDAAQEAASSSPLGVPTSAIMKGVRPLSDVTSAQQDKHRRDRKALEVLEYLHHQKRTQQATTSAAEPSSRDVPPSSAMQVSAMPVSRSYSSPPHNTLSPTTPVHTAAAAVTSSEKKTRRMTALFRGAVRPMGLMGSSSTEKTGNNSSSVDHTAHSVNELLALTGTQKASLVVNCGSSQVNVWSNAQRSFVFQLSAAEGGHILLQAAGQRELLDWCNVIEKASKDFALPVPVSATLQDNSASKTKVGRRGGAPLIPLYGSEVKLLVEHEKRPIPLGLLRMLEEVEARGLREQGIYRISGAKNAIEALKQAFSKQPADTVDLSHGELSDIHTIAGAIKQWFRDLPEPAVPYAFYHRLILAEQIENEEDRLYTIRDLVWEFPKAHFDLLQRVSQHLALVCDEGKHNLMAPHNVGLVFGTSLLNPPPGPTSVAESFGNIGKAAHIVKIILTMHEWLFEPEPEPEVEIEAAEVEAVAAMDGVRGEVDQIAAPLDESSHVQKETEKVTQPIPIAIGMTEEQALLPTLPSSSSPLPSASPAHAASSDEVPMARSSSNPGASPDEQSNARRLRVPSRERIMTESVYLDATDAIAVLQDPFEEEEDDEEDETAAAVATVAAANAANLP